MRVHQQLMTSPIPDEKFMIKYYRLAGLVCAHWEATFSSSKATEEYNRDDPESQKVRGLLAQKPRKACLLCYVCGTELTAHALFPRHWGGRQTYAKTSLELKGCDTNQHRSCALEVPRIDESIYFSFLWWPVGINHALMRGKGNVPVAFRTRLTDKLLQLLI